MVRKTLPKEKKKLAIGKATPTTHAREKSFPLVAIGASAGGLEAIRELLKFLSPDTGMAFIYVQHLSPDYKSALTEILSRETKMKVQAIEDMVRIQPDNLYIIPPNKGIEVSGGHIRLIPRSKSSTAVSIDVLFTSLAETHKENVIGIILSGTGKDGTLGLKAIRNVGGLTFAQDDSAEFNNMPRSAIAEGIVDFVLPPQQIAQQINRLSKHAVTTKKSGKTLNENFSGGDTEPDLKEILNLIHKRSGQDFGGYQMSTIERRILRRMLMHRLKTFKQYAKLLNKKNDELNLLCSDLLINVTEFFREPEKFLYLKTVLFPKLLKNKKEGETLRIWVAGCSTGQEAYSIAITLHEILGSDFIKKPIQIFATDLSEQAIKRAREGIYSLNEVKSVSAKQLEHFFTKANDDNYRINKSVRDMCAFAQHNILSDPPFAKLDFLSCCNVLIYFNPAFQKRALGIFHYALRESGYLMLGKSESTGTLSSLFSDISKKFKIYLRKKGSLTLPRLSPKYLSPLVHKGSSELNKEEKQERKDSSGLDNILNSIFLTEYVPASAVIDQDLTVLQLKGNFSSYLHLTPGKTSLNIYKMVRPEIASELRNAINKALTTKQSVRKEGIEARTGSIVRIISLDIRTLKIKDKELLLVIFSEKEKEEIYDTISPSGNSAQSNRRIKKLEEEKAALRVELLSLGGEHETAMEKLLVTNEEVVSTNEELQSMNQELETSKEEIESANEELNTTNQELQTRNEQLAESKVFSETVIATMHEPLLILDTYLNVKSANKSFCKKFQVNKEETEGKFLFELGNKQWDIPQLREMLDDILQKNMDFYDLEVTQTFPGIGKKIMLLNGHHIIQKTPRQKLILLSIKDITERAEAYLMEKKILVDDIRERKADNAVLEDQVKRRTEELERKNAKLESIFQYATIGILVVNSEGEIIRINPHTEKLFQYEKDELIGKKVELLIPQRFSKKHKVHREKYSHNPHARQMGAQMDLFGMRKDGTEFPVEISLSPFTTSKGNFVTAIIVDISARKRDEAIINQRTTELQKSYKLLEERNISLEKANEELETFTFISSHDLQEPLRKVKTFANTLLEEEQKNLSESGKKYLERMKETTTRMRKLIEDLLLYSRTKNAERKFEKTNLTQIAEEVIAEFKETIEEKKAVIKADGLCDATIIRFQFRQLLHNLISNALKFSHPERAPIVIIKSETAPGKKLDNNQLSPEINYCHMSVSDNGIGFAPQYKDQIFVVFQRLHESNDYQGTGIGLAICKRIVENHNGIITATSEVDKGARFDIYLPAE